MYSAHGLPATDQLDGWLVLLATRARANHARRRLDFVAAASCSGSLLAGGRIWPGQRPGKIQSGAAIAGGASKSPEGWLLIKLSRRTSVGVLAGQMRVSVSQPASQPVGQSLSKSAGQPLDRPSWTKSSRVHHISSSMKHTSARAPPKSG